MNRVSLALLVVFAATVCSASVCSARDGEPIAVRIWPGEVLSLENHWGLKLAVGRDGATNVADVAIDKAVRLKDSLHHALSRQPNQLNPAWLPMEECEQDVNRIAVHSDQSGWVTVICDGVRVVVTDGSVDTLALDQLPVDCVVLMNWQSGRHPAIVTALKPRFVVIAADAKKDRDAIAKLSQAIGAFDSVSVRVGNTFAISSSDEDAPQPKLIVLAPAPWKMNDNFQQEFVAMEKACSESQAVFAMLSTNQMNFKPSNGTHTPRWNTEHMMGRQLLFFSQIYHELDPAIPVMDLNPEQMPPDYEFAHPDWDGAEEARQMQRVSDFCRRFAYLLEGQSLDKQAPGSSWPTLQALLVQMQRHYSEHTANTVKKFDLPDWPEE